MIGIGPGLSGRKAAWLRQGGAGHIELTGRRERMRDYGDSIYGYSGGRGMAGPVL